MSEALDWNGGLSKLLKQAPGFYGVIIVSTLDGLALNFIGIDPIKALIFTAVFNGVAAVPLPVLIARINGDETILQTSRGGIMSRGLVWLTFTIMALSSVALLFTMVAPH